MKWSHKPVGTRNQLHNIMVWQIKCSLPAYFEARAWCWEQWGPGIEYEHWINYHNYTGHAMPWAWQSSKFQGASIDHGTLYLKDDAMMAQFTTKWKSYIDNLDNRS